MHHGDALAEVLIAVQSAWNRACDVVLPCSASVASGQLFCRCLHHLSCLGLLLSEVCPEGQRSWQIESVGSMHRPLAKSCIHKQDVNDVCSCGGQRLPTPRDRSDDKFATQPATDLSAACVWPVAPPCICDCPARLPGMLKFRAAWVGARSPHPGRYWVTQHWGERPLQQEALLR